MNSSLSPSPELNRRDLSFNLASHSSPLLANVLTSLKHNASPTQSVNIEANRRIHNMEVHSYSEVTCQTASSDSAGEMVINNSTKDAKKSLHLTPKHNAKMKFDISFEADFIDSENNVQSKVQSSTPISSTVPLPQVVQPNLEANPLPYRVHVSGVSGVRWLEADEFELRIRNPTTRLIEQSVTWFGGLVHLKTSVRNVRMFTLKLVVPVNLYYPTMCITFESATRRTQFLDHCLQMEVIRLASENDQYYNEPTEDHSLSTVSIESDKAWTGGVFSAWHMKRWFSQDSEQPLCQDKKVQKSGFFSWIFRTTAPTQVSMPNVYEPVLHRVYHNF